ncbi:MAG: hypothetical protein ACK526_01180 [Planctomyces sp.]
MSRIEMIVQAEHDSAASSLRSQVRPAAHHTRPPRIVLRTPWRKAVLTVSILAVLATTALSPITSHATAASNDEITLRAVRNPDRTTRVTCRVTISGRMTTPSDSGPVNHDLKSECSFIFDQREFPSPAIGISGVRAVRHFEEAQSETKVGGGHQTETRLPSSHRLVHLYGAGMGLIPLSPTVRFTRQQVDLLQIPLDPTVVSGLLPTRNLRDQTEKWNTEDWVIPALTGIEATASQKNSCQLKELTKQKAVISFDAEVSGAITGTVSDIHISGELNLDRESGLITEVTAQLKEKRSPGTVSPGLDVTADIHWTQEVSNRETSLPDSIPMDEPSESRKLLTLSTPWKLLMLHSRQWHLFHETSELVMLRMLHEGRLVAQCNVAPSVRVAPGTSTDPETFQSEVQTALTTRKGKIIDSTIRPDVNGWRIQRVRATSATDKKTILWDYYLCTQKTGEQFSLIFSRTSDDDAFFGDSAEQILSTMTMKATPARIPLPK